MDRCNIICQKKNYSREKRIHYQNVRVLNIKVEPTEEDKKKVEEFRKFIEKNGSNKENNEKIQ